jgi:hypothetical protein
MREIKLAKLAKDDDLRIVSDEDGKTMVELVAYSSPNAFVSKSVTHLVFLVDNVTSIEPTPAPVKVEKCSICNNSDCTVITNVKVMYDPDTTGDSGEASVYMNLASPDSIPDAVIQAIKKVQQGSTWASIHIVFYGSHGFHGFSSES